MGGDNEQPVVLVAESRPEHRDTLQEMLEPEFRVLTADDGVAALRMAREYLPDLIVVAEALPDDGGHRVCAELSVEMATAEIPVLLFATEWLADAGAAGLAAGAVDYLTLPLHPLLMRRRIHNYLALRHYRSAAEQACRIDAVTGIASRRTFDDTLEQEWRRGIRTGLPLSLLLVDLDEFRFFNDQFGFEVGDRCLRLVAHAVADALQRETDLAARYGGEEFACLLPETDLAGAMQLAERIRQAVALLDVGMEAPAPAVTASIGVASVIPALPGSSAQLVVTADRQLALAQEQGRNRVSGASAG